MGSSLVTGELCKERTTRLKRAISRAVRSEIAAALKQSDGNVMKAAQSLGISPGWLRRRLASLKAAEDQRDIELFGFVLYERRTRLRCEAQTRSSGPCRSRPVAGRRRCRMHGGASTGPRTPEGRRRVGEATRARYIAAALADGWLLPSTALQEAVVALRHRLAGSRHGTAQALRVTAHDVRRVLAGLPSRPHTLRRMEEYFEDRGILPWRP
jgi:transposase-like protein